MRKLEFEIGDQVKIISECMTKGKIGTVTNIWDNGSHATVNFKENNRTGNNNQVYNTISIVKINKGEEEMEEKVEMIDGYYILEVRGTYSKKYSYICRFENVKLGDKVVCEDENYIQTVIGIYNKDNAAYKNPTKEVVCIVDYSEVNKKKERAKLITDTKRKLDKRVKEIQSQIDYDFYASKDKEVAELLQTLKDLQ